MKQCYIEKRFNTSSQAIISQANTILEEYRRLGYVLTLRQLYYQLVAAVRRILDDRPGPQMMALMLAEIAICLSENRAALEEVSRIGKETG